MSGTFPGGIEVPTFDQSVGITPIRPGVGVRWVEQPDGALLANMTTTAWHKPGAGTPRTVEWELTVTTDPANSGAANRGEADLNLLAADGSLAAAAVSIFAGLNGGTGQSRTLVDDEGASSFLQHADQVAGGGHTHNHYVYYGLVNSNGTFGQGNLVLPWFRFGVGQYATNFTTPASMFLLLAQPFGSNAAAGRFTAVTATAVNVALYSLAGAVIDDTFSYIMIRDAPN